MPAFAGAQHFGQQGLRRRHGRPALLDFQQRPHGFEFGRVVVPFTCQGQLLHHRVGQRGRQWQTAAAPARNGRSLARRAPHPGGHLVDAHQRQQPAAKQEAVARLQACGKAFLHRADFGAADILHRHAGIADDGADVHAVAPRQPRIGDAPDALPVGHGAPVVRVRGQRRAALGDKRQAPVPVLARQVGIGRRAAHFGIQGIRHKAAAQRHRDQVLHQHVQRLVGRSARLDVAGGNRDTRRCAFRQFNGQGGHQGDARRPSGRMAGSASALEQARHALGRANLQHPLDWQKVNPQVQAGGTHHSLQFAVFQAQLHPFTHCTIERAVVQRDHAGPVRPRLQQRLVPKFGLRAGIGKHQRGAAFVDFRDYLRQQAHAQVAGPRKAVHLRRQQRVDEQFFWHFSLHQHTLVIAQQGMHGLLQITQGGRHTPK